MSTRAFDLQTPSKFTSFKLKNTKEAAETSAPVAAPADRLLAEMAIDTKNSTSTGNHATIDFQGDFRPILMALCYYAAQYYDALDLKQHSKVSPPTLVAYFLFVLYSFYLLCDLEVRPTPSTYTRFLMTPEFIDLKASLLDLDVPDFLVKFLQAIAPCADPRRPNITFVPTFACYSEDHDFGRYFPISIFLQCHNFVINQKTNDAPETLINKMMGLNVYNTTRIGNFFGQILHDGTDAQSYGNQLMQAFEGIINPALARSRTHRNVYSRAQHYVQTFVGNPNPYQILMNIDEENLSETLTLMRQIQSSISSKFKSAGKLSNVMSTLTGMNITIHGYSDFAIPTWHKSTIPQDTEKSDIVSAKTYAASLRFLSDPDRTSDTELHYPNDANSITTLLYLVQKLTFDKTKAYPTKDDLVQINGRNSATPPVRILDPYDYNATTFHNVYLSGSLIESLELDGSAVPLPNKDTVLDDENTLFLQSAIPYSDINPSINFIHRTEGAIYAERRTPIGPAGQPAATMLYDLSYNRLPNFATAIRGALPNLLPGFTVVPHIGLWNSIYSKIGFRIPNRDSKDNNRPNIGSTRKFIVWSPYRYYNGTVVKSVPENYFMITNLRTIYGTNPPLGETAHFLEVMPVS